MVSNAGRGEINGFVLILSLYAISTNCVWETFILSIDRERKERTVYEDPKQYIVKRA